MNVADAMTPRSEVVTVTIPGTRDDALEYLQEQAFSSVPVIKETDEGEEFRGIISRDALIESPDEDQLALLVEEVPAISEDTSIEAAAQVMVEDGERRLPIVDGQLKGIITVTDVIRSIANGDVDGDKIVGDLANRDINCVYEGTPLTVAERELSHANVPYGVVLGDDGDMSGMLTEVDIIAVARVVEGEDDTGDSIANQDDDWAWEGIKAVGGRYMPTRNVELPAEPVREFMTAEVVTVNKRRTAEEAAQLMIEHDIEQIPLLSGDELTGIVRDIDLLRGL
ncbi:CBS domain-containing protein [Haloarcula sp. KBTZ06]|nr:MULTISPECIES: CBS domain-containing protein [Haloarcula]AEM58669.1 putative inosine monophosphate dehydrogenase [Haloarcula hispanica ATCC 33960]AJF25648.1 signal transduction protein with CBS domains [Haloarcula sp. CBA1115]KAA9405709.1 CBS domain-containing protein [Haloarcula sp. CBA1131]KAA9408402.1 CBS domain-containing protein [Haloarcula hispanica]KZX46831.1 signal transduction protein [Haloarcula sp. K1]